MKNFFAFIDESGNSSQERFFGLGLMIIDDEIGDLYDAMKSFYDQAKDLARINKLATIAELIKQEAYDQISEISKSGRNFELKFKYINSTNNTVYRSLLDKYFSFPNVRFCALVIDKSQFGSNSTEWKLTMSPWDQYINQAAMLISNNAKEISPSQICVLADDLSRPTAIKKSFEKSLADAIKARYVKRNSPDLVFGVSRLESHASLLIQVVDILLGCVMFDYKKNIGLIMPNQSEKQEMVVQKLRDTLKTDCLNQNKTYHSPSYFSVWEYKQPKSGSWTNNPHPHTHSN